MARGVQVVRDAAYWEMGNAFIRVILAELNDALRKSKISDARRRKKICERFLFGLGNALDQCWFTVNGEKHYPLVCFTREFLNTDVDVRDVGTIFAPSPDWEYHGAALDVVEEFFEDPSEGASEVQVGVFGVDEPKPVKPRTTARATHKKSVSAKKPATREKSPTPGVGGTVKETMAKLEELGASCSGREVNLWHAGVSDAELALVGRLGQLKGLCIHEKAVTDEGLKHLKRLENLRHLSLCGSGITDAGLKHLGPLVNLRCLILSSTKVTDEGLKALKRLKNLEDLDLGETGIRGPGLAHLTKLPNLKDLALNGCPVGDAGLAHLRALPQLARLQLIKAGVTDDGLEHLAHLENLRVLFLDQNNIRGHGLPHLAKLRKLKALRLEKTKLVNATLEHFETLTQLRHLYISGTRTTAAGVAKLKKMLPRCQIQR